MTRERGSLTLIEGAIVATFGIMIIAASVALSSMGDNVTTRANCVTNLNEAQLLDSNLVNPCD